MRCVDKLIVPATSPALVLARLSALSAAMALANSLRRALAAPARFVIEEARCRIVVEGRLNLSHEEIATRTGALCTFVVPLTWRKLPPQVWCREPWRKPPLVAGAANAEWHVNRDGSLCWELPEHWADGIAGANATGERGSAVRLGTEWCLNSVRWLLYRHLEAFRRGLEHWDPAWPQWAHYGAGQREYREIREREVRARRRVSGMITLAALPPSALALAG